MKFDRKSKIFTVDVVRNNMPDIVADLEWTFPFKDECVDTIIAFNLMEHIYDFNNFTHECFRVLRDNGMLYIFVPFLVRFHPDPKDYFRFTSQALSKILTNTGFEIKCLEEVGRGPFTAACSHIDGLFSVNMLARMIFAIIVITATAGDVVIGLISTSEKLLRNYPLGYIAVCRKSV
jgi:SAM-dependent methyltransferase